MSTVCSAQNMDVMENLVVKLQAHSLALDILILENHTGWTNIQTHLLFTRLDALHQTARDFCALEDALRKDYHLESMPAVDADMPGE